MMCVRETDEDGDEGGEKDRTTVASVFLEDSTTSAAASERTLREAVEATSFVTVPFIPRMVVFTAAVENTAVEKDVKTGMAALIVSSVTLLALLELEERKIVLVDVSLEAPADATTAGALEEALYEGKDGVKDEEDVVLTVENEEGEMTFATDESL